MKISSKGRYAVAAMMDLALNQSVGPLTIADIAGKQNISLSYLEQIFAELRKAGLVRGTRGPGGGYRLARAPETMTVANIIEAIGEHTANSGGEDQYVPYHLWSNLSARVFDFLNQITLRDCLSGALTKETNAA